MHWLLIILFGVAHCQVDNYLAVSDDFYSAIVSSFPHENIIFSTEMIRNSLLFVYIGVEQSEAEELRAALHFKGQKLSDYQLDSQKIFDIMLQDAPVAKSFTRFYVRQNLKLATDYRMFVRHTDGKAENIAFVPAKLKDVNSLYASEMGDDMGEVVNQSYWTKDNMGILVNAMYFNLSWERSFNPEATYNREFRDSSNRTIEIPMMHEDNKFAFGVLEKLQATALLLPFSEGNLSMLLVKPNLLDNFAKMEEELSRINVHLLAEHLVMLDVFVALPKFHIRCDLGLKPALQKIGINKIFSKSKSFSTLLQRNTNFQIDEVRQVVSFEFQEHGIGPPPTSVGNGSLTHTFNSVKYFLATHPFAFYIIDQESTFFSGHVTTF
ncbi:hypothetical protein KR018_003789 [Drosophila ironensis]|nr:hypothetical protein KR018_003789 [Drosophila ironensis]